MNMGTTIHCSSTPALDTTGASTNTAAKSLEPALHLQNRLLTVHSSAVVIIHYYPTNAMLVYVLLDVESAVIVCMFVSVRAQMSKRP